MLANDGGKGRRRLVIILSSFWAGSGSGGGRVPGRASGTEYCVGEDCNAESTSPAGGLYVEVMSAVRDVQCDNERYRKRG